MKHASAGAASVRPKPVAGKPGGQAAYDLDMTGVDPLRIEEVRRRVAVVQDYLAETAPDDASRRRRAQSLGLSVNQFLALVRAWREHGRAVAISGSGAARGNPRADIPRSLPTESKDAAREVIAALGPDVPHVDAVRAVQARCAELDVKAPSPSSVWNMVMSARRDAARLSGGGDIIVSRCNLKLPVEMNGAVVFPQIALVVDSANGTILAAAMDGRNDLSPDLLADFRLDLDRRAVVIDEGMVIGTGDLAGILPRPVKPSVARTATARALGRGFGSVELIYQLSRAIDPTRVLRARKDRPLRPTDARRVILQQLALHNVARGAAPPVFRWND